MKVASALLRRIAPTYARVVRPMTLGVRLIGHDEAGRVFLVRHVHRAGWYLPGGGVERGETAFDAVGREAREEGCLRLLHPPRLLGVFRNPLQTGDHVLLFEAMVEAERPKRADREIAEARFFSPDALPEGTTPATRRRLAEWRGGLPPPADW